MNDDDTLKDPLRDADEDELPEEKVLPSGDLDDPLSLEDLADEEEDKKEEDDDHEPDWEEED